MKNLRKNLKSKFTVFAVLLFGISIFSISNVAHAASLTDNLRSYWSFDGSSVDSLGINNGFDTSITYVTGFHNEAASFDGIISNILLETGIVPTGNYTVSTWVNSSATDGPIWDWTDSQTGASGDNITLSFTSGHLKYGGGTTIETSGTYDDGNWHLVVVTVNSGFGDIYVDGTSEIAGPVDNLLDYPNPVYLRFGISSNLMQFYQGNLDESAWWDRVLDSSDVSSLWNSGVGFFYPFTGPTPPPPTLGFTYPSQQFNFASSTCTEVSTTTPYSYYCTATSTTNDVPYGDWLFIEIIIMFCVIFIPLGTLFSLFAKRQ